MLGSPFGHVKCLCGIHVCGVRIACTLYYALSKAFPSIQQRPNVDGIFCFHVVCTVYSYALCGAVVLPVHMSSNVEYFAGSHAYLLRPHGDKLVNGLM